MGAIEAALEEVVGEGSECEDREDLVSRVGKGYGSHLNWYLVWSVGLESSCLGIDGGYRSFRAVAAPAHLAKLGWARVQLGSVIGDTYE